MENDNSLTYYSDLLSMLQESKKKKEPKKFNFLNEIRFEQPTGTVKIPEFPNGGIRFEQPTGTVNIKEAEALIKKKKNNSSNKPSRVRADLLSQMKSF